jgi:hypothetical protein
MIGAPMRIPSSMILQIFDAYAPESEPADDREVLGKHDDFASIDEPPTRHDAIAEHLRFVHVEVGASMHDKPIQFDKRSRIEKQVDPLARGEFARVVLLGDTCRPASFEGSGIHFIKLGYQLSRSGILAFGHDTGGLSRLRPRGGFRA